MTAPTLTIVRHKRDLLYHLLCRRELLEVFIPGELRQKEGLSYEEFKRARDEERQLKEDLDERDTFDLTLPPESLATTLRRLREDAERALAELSHPFEPPESDEQRRKRLDNGAYICKLLMDVLDGRFEETP